MRLIRIAHWAGGLLLALGLLAGGPANALAGPAAPCVLPCLYDQTANPSTNTYATTSKFEAGNAPFDSQAADDFVVTNAFWHINTVVASGIYDGPGSNVVDSVLVQFYSGGPNSLPSALLNSSTIAAANIPNAGLVSGRFTMTLPSPVILGPGHYWLSVQANKPYSDGRQWGWLESTVQVYSASVWENPNGGQHTSCSTWQPRVSVCHEPATNSQGTDLVFRLEGSSAPVQKQIFLPVVRR